MVHIFFFLLKKESARAKTREELLAEERDYKRRRTSYRGKKVNRNPTEVHVKVLDNFSCYDYCTHFKQLLFWIFLPSFSFLFDIRSNIGNSQIGQPFTSCQEARVISYQYLICN